MLHLRRPILSFTSDTTHVVGGLADLPPSVSGIITLPSDSAWLFTGPLDLQGARLECPGTTTLYGVGQEAVRIKSTGLTGQPILEVYGTLSMRFMSFEAPPGELMIDLDGDTSSAYDWQYVNFLGGGKACRALDLDNFVGEGLAILDSDGFTFEGSSNSIVFNNSIFSPLVGAMAIEFEAAATINRRFRLTNCALPIQPGASGVVFNGPNVVNSEGFILDTVNFSGGGTYLTGITYLDDRARFIECRGITNSTRIGAYYWTGNATATVITATNTPGKVAGISTVSAINQRFAHSNNRLTYASALTQAFVVTVACTVTSGNNNQVTIYLYRNGVVVPGSAQTVTTNASGRAENVNLQAALELADTDYIEVWCSNGTAITNVTVVDLNVIARVVS